MNKYLILVVVGISAMVMTGCHESLEERCAREAKDYTKKFCPALVAKDIIVDSMTFDASSHTLWYYYSLQNRLDNAEGISKSKVNLRKELLDGVKNATSMKTYKDEGYNFGYVYYSGSKPGIELLRVVFHPKDYK